MPGDTQNPKTLELPDGPLRPRARRSCARRARSPTPTAALNLRKCGTFKDTIRGRDDNALFPLEQLGFLEAAKPLAQAFHDNDANLLFVDLFDTLHLHWGSPEQSQGGVRSTTPEERRPLVLAGRRGHATSRSSPRR